eukprot:TRINITY_DN2022_c2_g1_i1.p1 TRINITY_DN2022_c2_g1~~TRINITY_DN2022_c2_g1_i1.p1  ORF type:complete len:202 (+),score=41.10 TRINITY_DN2022_c2_g1_i1:62-667(+)
MAKGNAKANDAKNKKLIALFQKISLGINAFVVAYHLGYKGDFFSVSTILYVAFFAVQEYFALQHLEKHGKPQLGSEGQIVSCVNLADPKDLGLYTYVQDLLWVCWTVQVLLLITSYAWFVYVLVPLYGVYKAWDTVGPMLKKAAERHSAGQNPLQPQPGPGQRIQGYSRKDRRAAARQAEKDDKNAEKAAKKAIARASTKK